MITTRQIQNSNSGNPDRRLHRCKLVQSLTILCVVIGLTTSAIGQERDLQPVTSKRAVTWGNHPSTKFQSNKFYSDRNASDASSSQHSSRKRRRTNGDLTSASSSRQEFGRQDIRQQESGRQDNSDDMPLPPDALMDLRIGNGEPVIDDTLDDEIFDSSAEVIKQRYPSGRIHVKRQVKQDREGNYLNDGPWRQYTVQGRLIAEGQFKEGRMDGQWKRWHPANAQGLFSEKPFDQFRGPFLSEATFDNGRLNGSWSIFDPYQRKIIEIPYANGKRDGVATWYWPNSMVMRQVEFRDGKLDGELTEYDKSNRVVRKSSFDDGQEIIVRRTFFFKDQPRAENWYIGPKMEFIGQDDWWNAEPAPYDSLGDELQHGVTREWYANGQLRLRGQYEEGDRVGPFLWWYESGQKQIEGEFREGLKQGQWTWWHANGFKAIEGNYMAGTEQGVWTWWDDNGTIEDQRDFSEDPNRESIERLESIEGGNPVEVIESAGDANVQPSEQGNSTEPEIDSNTNFNSNLSEDDFDIDSTLAPSRDNDT